MKKANTAPEDKEDVRAVEVEVEEFSRQNALHSLGMDLVVGITAYQYPLDPFLVRFNKYWREVH